MRQTIDITEAGLKPPARLAEVTLDGSDTGSECIKGNVIICRSVCVKMMLFLKSGSM